MKISKHYLPHRKWWDAQIKPHSQLGADTRFNYYIKQNTYSNDNILARTGGGGVLSLCIAVVV